MKLEYFSYLSNHNDKNLKLLFTNDFKSSKGLMTFGVMSPDSKDALYDCHIIFPINRTIRKMNFGDSIPSLGNESKFP